MTNLTISIFGNKIFSEILNEMKLFSKYKIEYYEDLNLCVNDAEKKNQLVIFFVSGLNKNFFNEIKMNNFPLIFVGESSTLKNILLDKRNDQLSTPFSILDFKKKVITAIAKNEFKKNSLINLHDYVIDRNERKIKKIILNFSCPKKKSTFLFCLAKTKNQ